MKLFNGKNDVLYLNKAQWRKLLLATTIMVVALYLVAMIFSLCGSKYFILNYQNTQMDNIEAFFRERNIMGLISWGFTTLEFSIIMSFVLKRRVSIIYVIFFYTIIVIPAFFIDLPTYVYQMFPFICYAFVPVVSMLMSVDGFNVKEYGKCMLRLLFAILVVVTLQIMIFIIKSGGVTLQSVDLPLSANFCYAIEYDIALSVILYTAVLLFDREKGDRQWTIYLGAGLSSQTSKTQSLKSRRKILTKTQKTKLKLFYFRFFFTQLLSFLLLMVLPFLLGKVFEFLTMYLAFAVARYILGFKYSLHFKKETVCVTVGAVVFGILSLAVPFFYVVVIIAVVMGIALAVLLHLSYKYKGMFLFAQVVKPDKFAQLYVIFDGDLDRHHVQVMCLHRGLSTQATEIICDFTDGNKKSYIAKKHNYSEKTIERIINDAIETLKANS